MNRDWHKDMDLCERAGRNQGFAMPHLIAEQPQMPIYWLQQSAEWKAKAYELEVRNHEMLQVLERIKADIDEFRSYIDIDVSGSVEEQARAFNEVLRAEKERADKAEAEAEKWRREALRKYPTPDAYNAACAALHKHRERADRAEEREQKLREAIIAAQERFKHGNTAMALIEGNMHLSEAMDSLYPKE